jgi:hypothetical protein
MNGELSPGKRIVKAVLSEQAENRAGDDDGEEGSSDLVEVGRDEVSDSAEEEKTERRITRSARKQKGKKN